jgi:N6-adenosine-specific RNA methylase IME4
LADGGVRSREHSRKPDEFYDLIRRVSPGPRLDMFSREKRDGFEQHGNEIGFFGGGHVAA